MQIQIGSRVELKTGVDAQDMDDPSIRSFESGGLGVIDSLFPSGAGIVRFDNGKRLLVNSVSDRFVLAVKGL